MRVSLSLCLLFIGSACAEAPNVEKEACDHLANGPEQIITAAEAFSEATELKADHRRYLVNLIDIGGSLGGFVRWTLPSDRGQLVLFNENLPVKFFSADMVERLPATRQRTGRCPEIQLRFEFPAGTPPLIVSFQPTNKQAVGIVLEPSSGQ